MGGKRKPGSPCSWKGCEDKTQSTSAYCRYHANWI